MEENKNTKQSNQQSTEIKKPSKEDKKQTNAGLLITIIGILIITIGIMLLYFLKIASQLQSQPESVVQTTTETTPQSTETTAPADDVFVEIISPTASQKITSPVTVSGKSNFFEANTNIRIKDSNGKVLAETFTTADGWMEKLFPFSKSVSYESPSSEQGTVEVYENSPKDGSEEKKVAVFVTFADYNPVSSAETEWRTYTNPNPEYSISYPSDWILDNTKAVTQVGDEFQTLKLTLKKKNHVFEVTMPSAWGPGACIFDGDEPFDGPSTGLLAGPTVKITAGDDDYKRTVNPGTSIDGTEAAWTICHKKSADDQYTNHTPLQIISYSAPVNYDSGLIKTMDEILKKIEVPNP